jgi:HSP20 family protein
MRVRIILMQSINPILNLKKMTMLTKFNGGFTPFRSLLSDFFEGENLSLDRFFPETTGWMPAVNISETDKTYEIEMAVPGMKKNDFKIKTDDRILTISAERKEEKEEKKKNFTRQEYRYNSFERSFTLPENAKEEDIKAHYEDGILKLVMAKKAITVSKAKEITIA